MRSKRENTLLKLQDIDFLQCPICHQSIRLSKTNLICENHHTFDINRKGYVNFMQKNTYGLYDRELFLARRNIINKYYGGFIDVLNSVVENYTTENHILLDAGCGEGSYLNHISKSFKHKIGVDLATDGIQLATDNMTPLWLIGDLANLPVNDHSIDVILNILSPANYHEFLRVLNKNGIIIKVIPNSDYLKELRTSVHHNDDVYKIISAECDIIDEINYYEEVAIDSSDIEFVERMSPLDGTQNKFDSITIDLKIIVAKEK